MISPGMSNCLNQLTPSSKKLILLACSADVVLRLDGNQNIDPGTETLTIGQFYDHHRRLGHFLTLPKHAKPLKGSVLPIELAIDLLSVSSSVLKPSKRATNVTYSTSNALVIKLMVYMGNL